MTPAEKAHHIVSKLMLANDAFSKWMNIQLIDIQPGTCTLQASIRTEMLNGFQIAHGGIAYSIADSALAFASNSHGTQALSIETSISHLRQVKLDDTLTAVAVEKSLTRRLGIYEVTVSNQHGEIVALFKGTVYRTDKEWLV